MNRFNGLFLVFTVTIIVGCLREPVPAGGLAKTSSDAPMFGGSPSRNMVNLVDKNIPTTWNIEEGKQKNIKWVANLGSRAYGGPVVAGGKIYVGTNQKGERGYEKAV